MKVSVQTAEPVDIARLASQIRLLWSKLSCCLLWSVGVIGVAALMVMGNLHLTTGIPAWSGCSRHHRSRSSVSSPLDCRQAHAGCAQAVALDRGRTSRLRYGMHLNVPTWDTILFMPLIYFVSSLPIFYQGWGGREAIVLATIGSTGSMTSPETIALSITFGVVVFMTSLPGAVFWMMRPFMRKAIRMDGGANLIV